MSYPVVHWEIGGPDPAALREFYGKAFGWTLTPAGPDYTLVDKVGEGLAGGIMNTGQEIPPYVTIYIRVPDLDAKLAEIERLGGTVMIKPTPIDGTMSFALFSDPCGAVVGLLRDETPAET